MAIEAFKTDCATSVPNTGTKGCKINMKDIVKAIFAKKGTKLNSVTDTLDQALIDQLVRDQKIVVMPVHTFTGQPEATAYETEPDGTKNKIRDGKYEFLLKYSNKGVCFGNKLSGFAAIDWDVWLVDSDGTLFMDKDGTDYVGFATQLVDRDSVQINDASGQVTAYNLIVQLNAVGSLGFYSRAQPIINDFNILGLEGVNDIELTATGNITGDLVPFKALIACDGTTSVSGFEALARVVDTAGVATNGTATLTGDTYNFVPNTTLVTGNYILELYDTPNASDVVKDSEGAYYKSNDLAFTVA